MFLDLFKHGNIATLARTASWFLLDQRKRITTRFSNSETFLTKLYIPVFADDRRFLSRFRTVRVIFCRSRSDAEMIFKRRELYSAAQAYRPLQPVLGIHSVFVQEDDAHSNMRDDIAKILQKMEEGTKSNGFNIDKYISSHMKSGKIPFFEVCQNITSEYLFDNMFAKAGKETREAYRRLCLDVSRQATGTAVFLLGSSRALARMPLGAVFKNIGIIRSKRLDLRSFIKRYLHEHRSSISDVLERDVSDEDLRQLEDNYLTFVVAGFESTATSVAWTAYELARDPDLQERLRSELISASPGEGESLKLIVKESLRLHPPIPFFMRRSLKDHRLSSGEQVRSGDLVIFAIEEANLSGFLDGDTFKPQHRDRTMRSFTFGGGEKTCPGRVLAFKEVQIIISEIIRRYRLSLDSSEPPELKMNNSVTATPKFGMLMIATPVSSTSG